MYNFSKQQKIICLIIISILLIIIIFKLFNKENSTITIIPGEENVRENIIEEEGDFEEDICIVHIAGAVKEPGVYKLYEGERIVDAVKTAGGESEKANLDAINLAAHIYDGQKIFIPFFLDNSHNNIDDKKSLHEVQRFQDVSTENTLININSADSSQLASLPGIGPALAQRILDYRKNNGFFQNAEDIMNVVGIGEKRFESIKEHITAY